jgi:hypothetical protein
MNIGYGAGRPTMLNLSVTAAGRVPVVVLWC